MKVTAVQEPPVYYDLEATLARGAELIGQAAKEGATLVVFPEAWVPGYIDFVWAVIPGNDTGAFDSIDRHLWQNSVDMSKDGLAPIQEAAREHGVVVVIGINEVSSSMSRGTLYNTAVTIDATGEVLNCHRKLMPTNAERQVWGFGDGSTLRVVETAVGRIGTLLCWETYMPMARMALYAQNMEIYCVPTAYNVELNDASMRHIAKEGGCGVVSACAIARISDIPDPYPHPEAFEDWGDWLSPGGAIVVEPGGNVSGGPMRGESGLLTADIDLGRIRTSRRTFDVAGHYARPDVFSLSVDRSAKDPVDLD